MTEHKTQKGFTLIELIIAIAIFGILAALATPSFNTWRENSTAKAAAREVFGAFQRARSEAVSRNADITLTFTAGDSGTWTIAESGSTIASGSMPSGVSITSAVASGFNSRGLPIGGACTVVVDGAKDYTINLSAAGSISM